MSCAGMCCDFAVRKWEIPKREKQGTGEEPLPQRVREMVLCSLFLQHGFDSTEKDMDVPIGAGLQHMGKLRTLRPF